MFPLRPFAIVLGMLGLCCEATAKGPRDYLSKPQTWFVDSSAKEIATNILSYQSELGGWPKNKSTTDQPYQGKPGALKPTYDNGASTDELRFLAKIFNATQDKVYRAAFDRGLDYVLKGQYANGGWPQFHPPGEKYHRHITFNDNAMVRLMEFVREVATSPEYAFVDMPRRRDAQAAFDRGINCILKCQVQVDGKRTGWCAQHDAVDFKPQSARTYELASLSGSESVGITRLLMSLDVPTPEVVQAIESSIAWFRSAQLNGIRVDEVKEPSTPKGKDKVVVNDPAASPLWARFYDIRTNRPFFVDRDGIPKSTLADIGYERRNGYSWYGTWPAKLIDVEYPKWQKRLAKNADKPKN